MSHPRYTLSARLYRSGYFIEELPAVAVWVGAEYTISTRMRAVADVIKAHPNISRVRWTVRTEDGRISDMGENGR